MKKVIKWTIYFLALGLMATYIVCGIVIPEKTKEFLELVGSWLNTPLVIAGVSTTIGGIISFILVKYIMNNSKFGRKELDGIKKETKNAIDTLSQYKNDINETVNEYKQYFEELKTNCNNQVTIVYQQFEDLQTKVINALKTIPNKKVQGIVTKYEEEFAVRKEEIIEKTVNTNEYMDAKIKQMEEDFQEFMKQVEEKLNETKERVDIETKEE